MNNFHRRKLHNQQAMCPADAVPSRDTADSLEANVSRSNAARRPSAPVADDAGKGR